MSELQGHGKDAFLNNAADYWSSASESVSTVDSTCDYGAGDSGYLGQFSEGEDTTVGGEVRLTRQASDLSSEGEETDDNEINDNVGEDDAPSSSFNDESREISTKLLTSPRTRSLISDILSGKTPLPKPPIHPYPIPSPITRPAPNTPYPALHRTIQRYISSFQYNHTGLPPFFALRRDKGLKHVVAVSKQMIKEGLPIQCVEAVFLGVYLSMLSLKSLSMSSPLLVPQTSAHTKDPDDPNNQEDNENPLSPENVLPGGTSACRRYCGVLRIPISFKSECDGNIYRHIVLAIYAHNGKKVDKDKAAVDSGWRWGAMGISRRKTLMFKEMKYPTLGKLMKAFKDSYEGSWHKLLKVYVGLPFSYEEKDTARLHWRVLRCVLGDRSWSEAEKLFDRYAKECVGIYEYHSYTGKLPDFCTEEYLNGKLSMNEIKKLKMEAGTFTAANRGVVKSVTRSSKSGKAKGKAAKKENAANKEG